MKEMKAKKCMPDDKIPATDCTQASIYVGSQLVSDQPLVSAVAHRPCHQLYQAPLKSLMICRLARTMSPAQQCRSWHLVSVAANSEWFCII